MGKKLSPYGRKEWHRKHSGNKTVHKSIDAVFRGTGSAVGAMAKVKTPESTLEEWQRTNLTGKQLLISCVVGAILPVMALFGADEINSMYLVVVAFFFLIPFFVMILIFMVFNLITRPREKRVCAEKPEEKKPNKKISQVPNPENDPYLERWNNRKPSEIIELEMPEITFQSRYDFSKVRALDFGMENNQISIFIDGKNQLIAKEDILSLNRFLDQGYMDDTDVPMFEIEEKNIRFVPSEVGRDDYTRLFILPLTPTGKNPKYPLKMSFSLLSSDEQFKISMSGGKEIFGHVYYQQNGDVGKADIICWNHKGKRSAYFEFHIRRGKDGLCLSKLEKHLDVFKDI